MSSHGWPSPIFLKLDIFRIDDSPPQNQRFYLPNVSWLLASRKDTIENVFIYFLVCKGLSIDGVGVSRDTVFQQVRRVVGFETGDFVKEKLGGLP